MKKIFLLFLALPMAMTITSCKKGCTDPDATNYHEDNKRDDGSCHYEGNVVFWYTQATEDQLYSTYGSNTLFFYADGHKITGYWGDYLDPSPLAPDCNSSLWSTDFDNNPSGTLDMEGDKTKTISYEVLNSAGTTVFSGSRSLTANSCNPIELKF